MAHTDKLPHKLPFEHTDKLPHKLPLEHTNKLPLEHTHKLPHKLPLEHTDKLPHKLPLEHTNKLPHKLPLEHTDKLPHKLPFEHTNKRPLVHTHKLPHKPPLDLASLPPAFLTFLRDNAIDPSVYTISDLPRYVRLNTALPCASWPSADDLRAQLNARRVWQVDGVDGFFGIEMGEGAGRIVDCKAYKSAQIFGMDVSSGVAVHALELNPDDHVLDLCCAPGAKLCMIANLLASGTGTVTGVDISPHRAATCRSLVRRYKAGARARLFVADGTVFNVLAPRIAARRFAGGVEGTVRVEMEGEGYADGDVRVEVGVVRGRVEADSSTAISSTEHIRSSIPPSATSASSGPSSSTSSPSPSLSAVAPVKPFWAPKLLRFDPQLRGPGYLYDKVIVDAECTHDGSIAHILKYEQWGWDAFEKNFLSPDRINTITQLQRSLLTNAWMLLRLGGILVYSTCSLSVRQNEENVVWFLKQHAGCARLEPVPRPASLRTAEIREVNVGEDERVMREMRGMCVRFDPVVSGTSGFFVARVRKVGG